MEYASSCTKLILALHSAFIGHVLGNEEQYQLKQFPLCSTNDKIQRGLMILLPSSSISSSTQCARACVRDTECVGMSTTEHGQCYTHTANGHDVHDNTCSDVNRNDGFTFFAIEKRLCLHDGVWDSNLGHCACPCGSWMGDYCEQQVASCDDSYVLNGCSDTNWQYVDILLPDSNVSASTHCRRTNDEPTVRDTAFILLTEGNYSYNKTWADYLTGWRGTAWYGGWLGLRNMRAFTRAGYTTLVVQTQMASGNSLMTYEGFYIGDEDEGFPMNFTSASASGSLLNYATPDCLGSLQNVPFSTWDHAMDASSSDCAGRAGAGWWYPGCSLPCNLLGLNQGVFGGSHGDAILKMDGHDAASGFWDDFRNVRLIFKARI